MRIRVGGPADAAFVVEMARLASAVGDRPLPPADDPVLAQGLPPSSGTSVVALDRDRPVGAAWWHFREPHLLVAPDGVPLGVAMVVRLPAAGSGQAPASR